MSIINIVILITGGLFTGIVSGMTGASGVMVVIPLLTLVFGMTVLPSIGTSLMVDVLVALPIAWVYYRHGNTDLYAGMWIAVGAVLGAQVGALEVVNISSDILIIGLTIFMVFLGGRMWYQGTTKTHHVSTDRDAFEYLPAALCSWSGRASISLVLGFLLGLLTGFFGAGGGILVFLLLYFVLRLPLKIAIGTASLIMIITAASGMIGYFAQDNIDLVKGLLIGIAAAIGGSISAVIANKIPDTVLARGVGTIFIIVGFVMLGVHFLQ